jgi:hypothetical protein
MLTGLKRLFSGSSSGAASSEWDGLLQWAKGKGYALRVVQHEGFVVDGQAGPTAWRLEWGPSQRPYIEGQELRIRAELGLTSELQLVVLNRMLQEKMENDVFEQYVEGLQTRIDNQTPPEMRWLVMFSKLSPAEMGELAERYVALSSMKSWLTGWLQGPLAQTLALQRVEPETPVVLMIGRGRLMLRTAMVDPEVVSLQAWLRLFETAIREARRVAAEQSDAIPSNPASQWGTSALPGDERDR